MKKIYPIVVLLLIIVSISFFTLINTSNKNENVIASEALSTNDTVIDSNPVLNECDLIRIVDGDTLEVTYNSKKEKVRLIGINTPESVHPDETKNTEFGKMSSDFTKSQLDGKKIQLEFDVEERDKYGRLLAYVYVDGKMFNKTLLEKGYAQIATYPPNVKYVEDFKALQSVARENNKGLWAYETKIESTTSEISKSNSIFVASKNSDKVHIQTCEWAKKISENNLISFSSLKEATEKGYEPCKVCNPK